MEARVKALTREVGTLQEELKREVKRRQRAVERCKECERAVDLAEEHIKELRYSNKKLSEDLVTTRNGAASNAEQNSQAIATLKRGLQQMEAAAGQRASQSYERMHAVYAMVQSLQSTLFAPGNISDSVASAAQRLFAELLQNLSQLSGHLAAGTDGLANMLPGTGAKGAAAADGSGHRPSPGASSPPMRDATSPTQRHAGGGGAVAHPGSYQEKFSAPAGLAATDETTKAALAQLEGVIPHYRQSLARLKTQALALKDRLERSTHERQKLSDEMGAYKARAEEELRSSKERCRQLEAAHAAACQDYRSQVAHLQSELAGERQKCDEEQRVMSSGKTRVEEELQYSQERCRQLEAAHAVVCQDHRRQIAHLQNELAAERQKCEEQRSLSMGLQSLMTTQKSDIKKVLELVTTAKPTPQSAAIPSLPFHSFAYREDEPCSRGASQWSGRPGPEHITAAQPRDVGGPPPLRRPFAGTMFDAGPKFPTSGPPTTAAGAAGRPWAATSAAMPYSYGSRITTSPAPPGRGPPLEYGSFDLGKIKRDMESLDSEIAGLEESLHGVATNFSF
eukprot:jgi/Tetstr1/442982/TSEL_031042.t1